jgi:hypothetical protein
MRGKMAIPDGTTRLGSRLVALLAALFFALALPAGDADAGRHARSRQPHWKVGELDRDLSNACRRGRFNQRSDHRRHIGYVGELGAGTTGIARQGWNLRDPERRSKPEDTYHFADDGLSTCRVYVARDKPADR